MRLPSPLRLRDKAGAERSEIEDGDVLYWRGGGEGRPCADASIALADPAVESDALRRSSHELERCWLMLSRRRSCPSDETGETGDRPASSGPFDESS